MLQAASITVSTTLFATFVTMPRSPPDLGLGRGLHLSLESEILANTIARLSSSSSFCLTLLVGTAPRSVILGMYRSFAEYMLSSHVGVGLRQLVSSGQRRYPISGVTVGVWEKKDVG